MDDDLIRTLQALLPTMGKRPRAVVEHIMRHGRITTEELKTVYGYSHPPRAARDVRELGIPLLTVGAKGSDGRTLAAYTFPENLQLEAGKQGGRKQFSKAFTAQLYGLQEGRCAICSTAYDARYLQVDHRVPYEVGGEPSRDSTDAFMLVCGPCNRRKSWSCEHCANWTGAKDPGLCAACYWADPTGYRHIALKPVRRVDLVFDGDEVLYIYDPIMNQAASAGDAVSHVIKQLLAERIGDKDRTRR